MVEAKMTNETLRVLAAMAERPTDEHYGLELAEAAQLPKGSIYPMLARLERNGLVSGEWEDIDESAAGRRRRRYYVLTAEGARVAIHEFEIVRAALERADHGLPLLRRLFPGLGEAS